MNNQALDVTGGFSLQTRDGARGRCRGWKCPGRKHRPHRFAGPALKTAAIPTLVCFRLLHPARIPSALLPLPQIAETRKKRGGERRKAGSPHAPEPAEPGLGGSALGGGRFPAPLGSSPVPAAGQPRPRCKCPLNGGKNPLNCGENTA